MVRENKSIVSKEGGMGVIFGIGVDLCRISRMERCIENDHFTDRVFTPEEKSYAFSKPRPAMHFASSFAAREALSKASGLPFARLVFKTASVTRSDSGPALSFQNCDDLLPPALKNSIFHLSLSHDGDYAVAMVVIEGPLCHE